MGGGVDLACVLKRFVSFFRSGTLTGWMVDTNT